MSYSLALVVVVKPYNAVRHCQMCILTMMSLHAHSVRFRWMMRTVMRGTYEYRMPDDFLGSMEQAQQQEARRSAPIPSAPASDWFAFRKRHHDLWIGRTGEDGNLEDWQTLLRDEGADKLTTAIIACRSKSQKGSRIRFPDVLEALSGGGATTLPAPDLEACKRSKTDLLIWCVIHNPDCYADARCTWRDGEGTYQRQVSCGHWKGQVRVKERICCQGQTTWEKMRDRAAVAQAFIFKELGKEISPRTKSSVYEEVRQSKLWRGYLAAQQLIPSPTKIQK